MQMLGRWLERLTWPQFERSLEQSDLVNSQHATLFLDDILVNSARVACKRKIENDSIAGSQDFECTLPMSTCKIEKRCHKSRSILDFEKSNLMRWYFISIVKTVLVIKLFEQSEGEKSIPGSARIKTCIARCCAPPPPSSSHKYYVNDLIEFCSTLSSPQKT